MMFPLKGRLERLSAHAGTLFAVHLSDGSSLHELRHSNRDPARAGVVPAIIVTDRLAGALGAVEGGERNPVGVLHGCPRCAGSLVDLPQIPEQRQHVVLVCDPQVEARDHGDDGGNDAERRLPERRASVLLVHGGLQY
jgi:hypothetical protein